MVESNSEFIDPAEDCEWLPARLLFRRLGFEPRPPDQIDDFQLPGRLWQFIYALAARRFYLSDTNHLSDRELYCWLHNVWFEQETADIPPEAEWNTRITACEGIDSGEPFLWLRYYADEKERAQWAFDFPEDQIPPHDDPPFDRDRFLPDAPLPLEAHAGELPGDGPIDEGEPDPFALSHGELIAELNNELENQDLSAGPALESQLHTSEPDNWTSAAKQLAKEEIPLLPPDELTDETLTPLLWELLHNLACRGFFVLSTNHLNDRELYAKLWKHGLREPASLPGRNPRAAWFYDCIGSGSDEDNELYLRYYASDETRARHAQEWPDTPVPPKEKPPFDRDRWLPKGPF